MNSLTVYVEEYSDGEVLLKHGIRFSNSLIIKVLIDGEDIQDFEGFEDSLIYFDELKESAKKAGKYLIFTCSCGIAEDGGWEGVDVDITDDQVTWVFEVGDKIHRYTFDKSEYLNEIQSVLPQVEGAKLKVEPSSVMFPEGFRR
jgi:hypothetical protein